MHEWDGARPDSSTTTTTTTESWDTSGIWRCLTREGSGKGVFGR